MTKETKAFLVSKVATAFITFCTSVLGALTVLASGGVSA